MLNFDKNPYSSEKQAIQGSSGNSLRLVANGGRWGAIILVLQVSAFTIPALFQLLLGKFDSMLLLPLVFGGLLLYNFLPRVFRPFAIEVTGDKIYFQGTHAFHCPTTNVGRVFFDGNAIRIFFRDLNALLPDANPPSADAARELQTALQDAVNSSGTHLNLPGFSVNQTDELRQALKQPNSGFRDVAEELESFHRVVQTQTPVVWVTPLMVGLNLAIFGWMIASGVPLMNPNGNDVMPWGANFGPLTLNGEWWRLFTCMFLHFGIIHIACNMFALQDGGAMLERLTGNIGFGLLYIISGFCGSLPSVLWSPDGVSAGASGAVFGVFGALVVWHYLRRRDFPPNIFRGMMRGIVPFIGFNLLIGASSTGIDQAAHIGGLVSGGLCGLLLCHPLTASPHFQRLWRNVVLAVIGAVLIFVSIRQLPKPAQAKGFFGESMRFSEIADQVITKYNTTREQLNRGEITPTKFGHVLQDEILPPWSQARDHLKTLKFSNPTQQARIDKLIQYATLRAEAWTLQAEAIANNDIPKGFTEAQKKLDEAEALGNSH